jgi:hypothetical protein
MVSIFGAEGKTTQETSVKVGLSTDYMALQRRAQQPSLTR